MNDPASSGFISSKKNSSPYENPRPQHHVTIPCHTTLKIGTLNSILKDVAAYLEINRQQLVETLFSK